MFTFSFRSSHGYHMFMKSWFQCDCRLADVIQNQKTLPVLQ